MCKTCVLRPLNKLAIFFISVRSDERLLVGDDVGRLAPHYQQDAKLTNSSEFLLA